MSTGPKTSRCTISLSFERGTDERRLVEEAAALGRAAAAHDLVAVRPRALDEAGDALEMLRMDQRRNRRRVVAGIAEHVLVGEAVEELEERAGDRLLDEQARAGEADLARVVVLAGRLARRCLEVAVGEDEERALAAELAGERDEVARGGDADRAGGLRRSRERDAAHARVGDERGADLLADALHDVEHARRAAPPPRPGRRAASTTAATIRRA